MLVAGSIRWSHRARARVLRAPLHLFLFRRFSHGTVCVAMRPVWLPSSTRVLFQPHSPPRSQTCGTVSWLAELRHFAMKRAWLASSAEACLIL